MMILILLKDLEKEQELRMDIIYGDMDNNVELES